MTRMGTDTRRFICVLHSLDKYTLCTYHVPCTAQIAGDTEIKKKQPSPSRISQSNKRDYTVQQQKRVYESHGSTAMVGYTPWHFGDTDFFTSQRRDGYDIMTYDAVKRHILRGFRT